MRFNYSDSSEAGIGSGRPGFRRRAIFRGTRGVGYLLLAGILFLAATTARAQNPVDRLRSFGNMNSGGGGDSLAHRTGLEDSITIRFRYLDSSRYRFMDSSILDFSRRYPIPDNYVYLGNTGSAARSILFDPIMEGGWDAGFHAYDIYRLKLEDTRFYNTTRPFSEIGYVLGSNVEQDIKLLHTQNITPDWNAAFQYNMINSPGAFRNQNTNHNNIRLSSSYQGKNKRYHLFFILMNNKLQAADNGGIKDDEDYMNNLTIYSDRSLIPVQLGNSKGSNYSVFNTSITTGTKYKNAEFMLRQQYDVGIKDSLVTDSSVIRLFYPKLRFEHTFRSSSNSYSFVDNTSAELQDTFYKRYYGFPVNLGPLLVEDSWKELENDLSIYQFPDSRNSQQFFKAGATVQTIHGTFKAETHRMYNIFAHGEYRNKTRNQKWDIEANGKLYAAGFNAGDYNAYISLQRYISKEIGYLQAGFQNVNRTPSYIFNNSLYIIPEPPRSFNKENITNIFGSLEQPHRKLRLTGSYYLVSNYMYFRDYYHPDQASALFNLLQVSAQKDFTVGKRWHWQTEITLQQKTGAAPVNVPLIYTRNLFYFQGSLGFKNLLLLFGTELKYHTPYKADGYSPMVGQFVYQDSVNIALKAPHIAAFLHFRIKTFTAYVRAENLNAVSLREGFGFTNNNFAANNYPYPGMQLRLGIFWGFVN